MLIFRFLYVFTTLFGSTFPVSELHVALDDLSKNREPVHVNLKFLLDICMCVRGVPPVSQELLNFVSYKSCSTLLESISPVLTSPTMKVKQPSLVLQLSPSHIPSF